ncbi:MAG: Nif3-like dinuclear metal center hexameric protein [Polyangiaceae bacterium]|nr:Nif3-like dinuclear metal center hexameric protein [Polyangiaceae bacterium]
MHLDALLPILDSLAPLRFAESWDNVGLLVGDPARAISRILVTVDYTHAVAEEARAFGAELVVAYHPPMFAAVKRVPHGALWADAVRRDVGLYSMHTALDVAQGGTNDVLADACGIDKVSREALRPFAEKDAFYKLVTFVPESDVERVSRALFEAGAGRIGGYTQCSFRAPGTGTFFGEEGTNPAVGVRGKLETASEIRLETIVPVSHVTHVVKALRASHSYEEPAFDLVRLAPVPEDVGLGRIGNVALCTGTELIARVKKTLGISHVLAAGRRDERDEKGISRVAVAAGAGGELLSDALRAQADAFVTGELRHHDALEAARHGMLVVSALHSNSERAAVFLFAERLGARVPDIEVRASTSDADPFTII